MKKFISILVLIAFYDTYGFCMMTGRYHLAMIGWIAFTGTAGLYVIVMTTRFVIMLLELPELVRKGPYPESNK